MTICLTLSHCGLLRRRIKSDLLTAIIKWSQLAPIKPHGSRASIQASAKFSVSFTHRSVPWFIFLKPIKSMSYQAEQVSPWTTAQDTAHLPALQPPVVSRRTWVARTQNAPLRLLTHAGIDPRHSGNRAQAENVLANINPQWLFIRLVYNLRLEVGLHIPIF